MRGPHKARGRQRTDAVWQQVHGENLSSLAGFKERQKIRRGVGRKVTGMSKVRRRNKDL